MRELKIYDESMQDEVDTCLTQEDKEKTYPKLANYFIRLNISMDQEFSIQRQRDTKPLDFANYNDYCERCKTEAKKLLGL